MSGPDSISVVDKGGDTSIERSTTPTTTEQTPATSNVAHDTTLHATDPSKLSINNASRRGGRVHWDAASVRKIQGQQGGATVTVRSAPKPKSVQRALHPGPLGLASLLDGHDGSLATVPDAIASADRTTAAVDANKLTAALQPPPTNQEGIQPQVNLPTLSLTGAKGLDEQGLDNRAFLELQRELQRHEASGPTGRSGDEVNEMGDQATEMDHHGMSHRNERRRRIAKPETPDWSSGATTPNTDHTSDSGSYDPANDSDLDHIDLVPGEVDGLPARIKKKKPEEEVEKPKGWSRLRGLLLRPQEDSNEDDLAESQREKGYEEGGPTNLKSVPVTTSSGTRPGGPRSRPNKFEREAARLVKAHRLMTGQRSSLDEDGPSGFGVGSIPTTKRDHLDSGATTPDRMDTAANLSARPLATGGILGNLLKLYEQQQREEKARQSGFSSNATSPLSTPAIESRSDRDGLNFLVESELKMEKDTAGGDSRSPPTATNTGRKGWGPSASPGTWNNLAGGSNKVVGASKKVLTVAAKETGFEDAVDERPKASRSAGGTIGALIATTGNLIGAVSPHHAQLGPNPKRPGYTLDRYLLPEMNAKTLRKTAQIVADAAPRPFRSQPGTPGYYHSPPSGTAIARKETNDSAETQAVTPPSEAHSPKKVITRPSSLYNVRTGPTSRKSSSVPFSNLHLPTMPSFARTLTNHSTVNTPDPSDANHIGSDYFGTESDEQAQKAEWQRKLRKRAKDKRKKEEIFITMHVAAILQRQEFLMKLSRALMMFGAPTHRIETQIQQTARVLEINCRCIYLPNLMLLAFGDDTTHTSETKFIKQSGGLDLTKLTDMHSIYWNVIHDKIGVGEASRQLDELMRRKPLIGKVPMVFIGGLCSSFICVGTMGFSGSFIDALAAFPLGMFLVFCQINITTELFSNVFEILFAAINSFVAAALASTGYFCYGGVISGSIVLILPGFIVLSGALELQSKNLIAGSVRLVYAIIYSLFLGFGISIGSSFWLLFSGSDDSSLTTRTCSEVHANKPWWMSDVKLIYALLTVPGYSIALSLRNQAKITRKEFPVMVLIAIAGWATNHFSSTSAALSSRSDVTSALGAMAVGLLSNLFGRIYDGKSYTVACVGVLYQLPSGLSASGSGTLLNFADTNSTSTANFNSGFEVAETLVEVAIGLTVGLYAATVVAYLVGGRKVRGGGLFSF
ncbi:hypothetical protein CBS101457_004194 [Exobasidium rhododendri]|nr:hypothetical protein CBS101457_004194 [Exobasidium rhododendri]